MTDPSIDFTLPKRSKRAVPAELCSYALTLAFYLASRMYRTVSSCHGLREKEEEEAEEEKGTGDADVQASFLEFHTDYPDCSRNSTRGNTLYITLYSSVCASGLRARVGSRGLACLDRSLEIA